MTKAKDFWNDSNAQNTYFQKATKSGKFAKMVKELAEMMEKNEK